MTKWGGRQSITKKRQNHTFQIPQTPKTNEAYTELNQYRPRIGAKIID